MSQMSVRPIPAAPISFDRCDHAVVRGEFPALVFSGDVNLLGELPGECTASTLFKFAMIDERLDSPRDFARTPHMPLPLWPVNRVRRIDGVCFVLSDEDHPALDALRQSGGIEDEHFVIAQSLAAACSESRLLKQLASMVRNMSPGATIALIGYGDQGARIGESLCAHLEIDPARLAVIDDNQDSRRRASSSGHLVVEELNDAEAVAVIYTPLMRYERLYRIFAARPASVIAIDNSSTARGAEHFIQHGCILLEPASDRALEVKATRIKLRSHGLPIQSAALVRDDERVLGGKPIRQLSSGHRAVFYSAEAAIDLARPGSNDGFAPATFNRLNKAYVSLRDRPAAAVFAARSLCAELWPNATSQVFPARCVADLGATRFERLLKRHIDGAEIITASQTAAQQSALGIIANHYAADSPIVEIGSALGGSGVLMAAATDRHRPPFYSVDPETATRHVMRWAFEQHEQLERLCQIIAASDDAILQLQDLHGRCGLVFIDGLHTFAATAADFANYAPLVRPGGALLIHDVEPARYSVLRVVVERVLADARFVPRCMIDGLLVMERLAGR